MCIICGWWKFIDHNVYLFIRKLGFCRDETKSTIFQVQFILLKYLSLH